MCAGVVSCCSHTLLFINSRFYAVICIEATALDMAVADKLSCACLLGVDNLHYVFACRNCTAVAYLSAAFCVERCNIKNDRYLVTLVANIGDLAVLYHSKNLAVGGKRLVAYECGSKSAERIGCSLVPAALECLI